MQTKSSERSSETRLKEAFHGKSLGCLGDPTQGGLGCIHGLRHESAIISAFAVAARLRVTEHAISLALDWVGKRGVGEKVRVTFASGCPPA